MSSSLLQQKCPACLVHFISVVLEMGRRRLYSCCFEACCYQKLFKARSILVQYSSTFHSVDVTRPLLGRNCFFYFFIE